MIRLGQTASRQWLDLPYGVRILVEPLTAVLMETARQIAATEIRDLRDAMRRVREGGGSTVGVPNLDDPAVASAHAMVGVTRALGRIAIVDWQGVVGLGDEPLPCTPEEINRLLDVPSVCAAFFEQYTATLDRLAAEKNG